MRSPAAGGAPQTSPPPPGAPRSSRPPRPLARLTLRARLIAGLLVLFTLASVGVGVVTTAALRDFQLRQLDQQLFGSAQALAVAIEHSPDEGPTPQSGCAQPSTRGEGPPLTAGQPVGTYAARFKSGQLTQSCEIKDTNGAISLTFVPLSPAGKAALSSVPLSSLGHMQAYSLHLFSLGDYRLTAFRGPDGAVHVAGLPLSGVEATVRQLELVEIAVFGAALVIMGLAGTVWIRLSLRPLARITSTAAEVSRLPLASEVELPHRVPNADPRTEVGQLSEALNRMLGHVESSLARREATEARLRQFVADASHELRTPLAGIRGYTELAMRSKAAADADLRHALGRVDAESARMARLVDDLLLLARLDAGRPLAHEPVDLTRLAIEVTDDARVAGPQHRWALDLPGEAIIVTGDQHRLHQVLANLLTNARTHTPPGTTVTVRLIEASSGDGAGGVELTVSDDGPGIAPMLQATIFERFARGDSKRSRKAGSTGLGLAIVAAVVAAHGGRVSVTSRQASPGNPGRTTFRIWLPNGPQAARLPASQAVRQAAPGATSSSTGRCVPGW